MWDRPAGSLGPPQQLQEEAGECASSSCQPGTWSRPLSEGPGLYLPGRSTHETGAARVTVSDSEEGAGSALGPTSSSSAPGPSDPPGQGQAVAGTRAPA